MTERRGARFMEARQVGDAACLLYLYQFIDRLVYQSVLCPARSPNNFHIASFPISTLNLPPLVAFISARLSTPCASAAAAFIISRSLLIDCARPGFSD